jgi:hypothetical protein
MPVLRGSVKLIELAEQKSRGCTRKCCCRQKKMIRFLNERACVLLIVVEWIRRRTVS